jgi:hypothetical protein
MEEHCNGTNVSSSDLIYLADCNSMNSVMHAFRFWRKNKVFLIFSIFHVFFSKLAATRRRRCRFFVKIILAAISVDFAPLALALLG